MRLLLDESVPARLRWSLTVDKNLPYQQNLGALPIALIVLEANSNELVALLPLVPRLEQVLGSLKPRSFARIPD